MIAVLGVLALYIIVVFFKSKSKIDDAYAQNAAEMEAKGKNPVQPIGGNSSYEAGCMTIVVIVGALALLALIAGALPAGMLLPK